ncbi:MAG: SDR family oxidoreductase [Lentisphaerota bacterium]
MLTNSRILITGGAGFIGSNLVETFLKCGNQVICLDDLSTGKKENISEFLTNKNFTFIQGDIRNFETCRKSCEGVEFVFHHAALGSVPRSIKNPIATSEVNIMGFLNVLTAARDAKVKKIIYASSSSVYGDDATLPKIESRIGKPLSPYAITKRVNELFAENFSRLYGLETIGLRYFNVFGKKQDPNGAYAAVIPKFIAALIKHESPIINGDGTISRDFTFVDNVVHANQLTAISPIPQPTTINQQLSTIFNIACGQTTSINELFHIIRSELTKYDSSISSIQPIYGASRKGEILHSNADITQAMTLIGYSSKFSVLEGLKEIVKYYLNLAK